MWGWLAIAVVGGFALIHFSNVSAQQASDLVHKAVAAALLKENDPAVLTTFGQKLRKAGYDIEAAQIDARAHALYGVKAVPKAGNVLRNLHL